MKTFRAILRSICIFPSRKHKAVTQMLKTSAINALHSYILEYSNLNAVGARYALKQIRTEMNAFENFGHVIHHIKFLLMSCSDSINGVNFPVLLSVISAVYNYTAHDARQIILEIQENK